MKTLIIVAMLLSATPSHAEQMVLSRASESEALALIFLMCPTCVVAHIADGARKKEEPKKVPDSKIKEEKESIVERNLASETKKVSK